MNCHSRVLSADAGALKITGNQEFCFEVFVIKITG